jgi:hypothetical protein
MVTVLISVETYGQVTILLLYCTVLYTGARVASKSALRWDGPILKFCRDLMTAETLFLRAISKNQIEHGCLVAFYGIIFVSFQFLVGIPISA